jgi:acetylornithine deacetylase/succinyl-diaminopimelate desuccinylase-like protein
MMMKVARTTCAILPLLFATAAAAQVPAVNWEKQKVEILRHYRALVQIDTSNPPGNETKAVEYLKKIFDAEGIPAKDRALLRRARTWSLASKAAARRDSAMAHTDVVVCGARSGPWTRSRRPQGWLHLGEGHRRRQRQLVAKPLVMLLAKRSGALDRDLIFFAEPGEGGSTGRIEFMVNQHFGEIDAEFALTEGGRATLENGRVVVVAVSTTEKVPRRVRLVVNGTSGHASIPRIDNALVHLSAAVAKLGAWQTPMRLNETTRAYFDGLSAMGPPEKAARYKGLTSPERSAAIQQYLAEYEPQHYSMLRTSVVPTILKAGFRMNVIPSEAEATIDVRALPDEDVAKFYEEMRRVIGDPAVRIEPLTTGIRPVAPPSRLDTEMYRALEQVSKRLYPGSTTLPTMLTGATDMAFLRAKGIQSYGIGPASTDEDNIKYGAHSDIGAPARVVCLRLRRIHLNVVTEIAGPR